MQSIAMQSQPSPRWKEVALSWMDPRLSVLTGMSSSKTRSLTRCSSHSQDGLFFFFSSLLLPLLVQ
jgi:hypothetical protein